MEQPSALVLAISEVVHNDGEFACSLELSRDEFKEFATHLRGAYVGNGFTVYVEVDNSIVYTHRNILKKGTIDELFDAFEEGKPGFKFKVESIKNEFYSLNPLRDTPNNVLTPAIDSKLEVNAVKWSKIFPTAFHKDISKDILVIYPHVMDSDYSNPENDWYGINSPVSSDRGLVWHSAESFDMTNEPFQSTDDITVVHLMEDGKTIRAAKDIKLNSTDGDMYTIEDSTSYIVGENIREHYNYANTCMFKPEHGEHLLTMDVTYNTLVHNAEGLKALDVNNQAVIRTFTFISWEQIQAVDNFIKDEILRTQIVKVQPYDIALLKGTFMEPMIKPTGIILEVPEHGVIIKPTDKHSLSKGIKVTIENNEVCIASTFNQGGYVEPVISDVGFKMLSDIKFVLGAQAKALNTTPIRFISSTESFKY